MQKKIEEPMVLQIMDKIIGLGEECAFCGCFWDKHDEIERREYLILMKHLYLSHREEALELSPKTVTEFL